jgi:PilZ domain
MLGVRVQFGHTVADLVDLSRTGALMHANSKLRPGSEWPMLLELPAAPVRLTGRVVRCVPADVSLPGGAALRGQYALAITFVDLPAEAQAILEKTCGTAMEMGEPTG